MVNNTGPPAGNCLASTSTFNRGPALVLTWGMGRQWSRLENGLAQSHRARGVCRNSALEFWRLGWDW